MTDQTLEAIIKLKDEISKPLNEIQSEMKDLNKTSSDVNSAMKDIQKATGDAGNDLKDTSKTLKDTSESARKAAKELGILQSTIKKTKPVVLNIKNKATPVLEGVKTLLNDLMNSRIILYIKDKVTPILNKIKNSKIVLIAKDKISPTLDKVKGLLKAVTKKAWKAIVKIDDKISPKIRKITGILKSVIDKTYKAVVTVKDKASSVLSSIKGKLLALAAGVTIGIKAVLDTTEASKEYNRNRAVISGAAAQGGYNEKDLKAMRRTMYGYTGDDMMATNAVSNLTGMGLGIKDMQKTLDAATAVWTKYGDSIPIEGLTESINETAQVSKVTGNLADALNWAGVSEDDFNAKLEKTKTLQGRTKLINDTLMKSYGKSKQIYDENTKAMREYNESQDAVAEKQAQLGQTLAPVNTMINNVKVSLMNGLMPIIQQFTPQLLEFGEKVKSAFETFRKSEEANNLLQLFKTVFKTVWNAAKAVIDAVSPTIKDIFTWIADHSEQITSIIKKLGKIWENVWGTVGPLLQAAWAILKPILSSFIDALDTVLGIVEKVSGAISGLVNAFKNLASAWSNGDVQKALSNSNAANGNNTYQATFGGTRAMGQSYVPRNNMLYRLHQGEAILSRRDADKWRQGQGNSTLTIAKIADTVIIREEADIDRFAEKLVRKINEQRIITKG